MTKFDYHTHHERCGHATGQIKEYIEVGIENGLDIIGISDHSPHFYSEKDHLVPGIAMKKSEFEDYVKEVLHLKEVYKDKIDVLLGVESDFFPDLMDVYKKEYKKYPFDYFIGSVHHVNGLSIFNKDRWKNLTDGEILEAKETYYQLIQASAKSGMFQILGHVDAMKTNYKPFSDLPSHMVDDTLKVIAENNVAIEVNTSGGHKGCGWYPTNDILERAFHYKVDITFGSDAHVPERVGEDFETVAKILKEIGYKKWCYFKNQEKFYTNL